MSPPLLACVFYVACWYLTFYTILLRPSVFMFIVTISAWLSCLLYLVVLHFLYPKT